MFIFTKRTDAYLLKCLSASALNRLTHRAPENHRLDAPADGRTVRVADAQTARESLEAGVGHLVHVPDASVGNCADAAHGPVHICVYFAPARADVRVVRVLHDHDFGAGNAGRILCLGVQQ